MPLFGGIRNKLRARRENGNAVEPAFSTDVQDSSSGNNDTTMQNPTTAFHYIQTNWQDDSVLADIADKSDLRQTPDGPGRIDKNMQMYELGSMAANSEHSYYYVANGRPNHEDANRIPQQADHQTKSYNPTYRVDGDEDWQLRTALTQKGTGSLKDFGDDHLRGRHFFQIRSRAPEIALGNASYQIYTELKALHLEHNATYASSTYANMQAEVMEGQLLALQAKNRKMHPAMEEMRRRIEKRKTEAAGNRSGQE